MSKFNFFDFHKVVTSLQNRIYRFFLTSCLFVFSVSTYAELPIGEEFLVNSEITGNKNRPDMAILVDGGYLITWSSEGQDGDGWGVFAQRYQIDGTRQGDEFQVNLHTISDQKSPAVAGLTDGGFIIVWESSEQDGDGLGVFAQRYKEDGSPMGEFQVNTYIDSKQNNAAVAGLADGGFIITWYSYAQDAADHTLAGGVFAQKYLADGSRDGNEFQVNTYSPFEQGAPDVSALTQGGFVITWTTYDLREDASGIYAQRYTSSGTPDGSEFNVNSTTQLGQHFSVVTSLDNGDFIITWHGNELGQEGPDGHGVYGQRYQADGMTLGEEFLVNSLSIGDQTWPSITSLTGGGFAIVWQSQDQDGDLWGIFGQRYKADGSTKGEEFMVNSITSGEQTFPVIGGLSNDGFMVSWLGVDPEGDGHNIYARKFKGDYTNKMELGPLTQPLYAGNSITLPINVAGSAVYGIEGQMIINNPELLKFTHSQYEEFFLPSERFGPESSTTDDEWFGALTLLSPAEEKTGEGKFATVTLKATEAGTASLTLYALFSNKQGNLILESTKNYFITILESFTLSGNLSPFNINGSYDNVQVYINQQQKPINENGNFSENIPPGEVEVRAQALGFLPGVKTFIISESNQNLGVIPLIGGDINGDQVIDSTDLTLLLNSYRSIYPNIGTYNPAADFNRDNQVNIQDLSILGNHLGLSGPQNW